MDLNSHRAAMSAQILGWVLIKGLKIESIFNLYTQLFLTCLWKEARAGSKG